MTALSLSLSLRSNRFLFSIFSAPVPFHSIPLYFVCSFVSISVFSLPLHWFHHFHSHVLTYAHTNTFLGILLYYFPLCIMWIHCFDHFTGRFRAFVSHHILIPTQISANISIELTFYFIISLCLCACLSLPLSRSFPFSSCVRKWFFFVSLLSSNRTVCIHRSHPNFMFYFTIYLYLSASTIYFHSYFDLILKSRVATGNQPTHCVW